MKNIEEQKRLIEFEKRERYCLQQIVNRLREKNPDLEFIMYTTPVDSGIAYDATLTVKEQDTIISSYIIELKNRTHIYDTMFFEKKKLNGLNKAKKSLKFETNRDFEILYINVTEFNTLVFQIDNMDLKKTSKQKMSSKSFELIDNKRNKMVYSLSVEEATKFDFKYDEQDYIKSITPPAPVVKEKKMYSIF